MLELDGSWRNPDYIRGSGHERAGGENVFCLSLSVASEILNMTLRMPIAEAWWPVQEGVERNVVTGRTKKRSGICHENCTISQEKWVGDCGGEIIYLTESNTRFKNILFVGIKNFFRRSMERL